MTPEAAAQQAQTQPQLVNVTIDGKTIQVKPGITIIEAIDQVNIPLPRYCYHPGLSIAGNCRICQVEVEKMPRTVIACNTRVAEGMVIHTQSAKANESQKVVLEFLLANHPLDCPVCDQAGECKLQDYYMEFGVYDPKFNENKVKKTKKAIPVGPTIMLDQERCVLCSRCVRFTDEVTKTHEFGIFNRGDHAEVDVYKELDNKYSGNVADICPVGALTDRDFRFKMRVWYLGTQKSVCPGCSRGCNISVEFEKSRPYHLKSERVMRLKPVENPQVNKWWMCDEGRYGYKPIDQDRILAPRKRAGSAQNEASWEDAVKAVSGLLLEAKVKGARWAVIASAQYTNEDLFLQKKIFKDFLHWNDVAFRSSVDDGYEDAFLIKKDKNPNTSGASQILGLKGAEGQIAAIVDKAKRGELDGLFIFGWDLERLGAGTIAAVREKVKTIVFEGPNEHATSAAADWVLPAASYAEKDGTFTNFEGRVQRIRKALNPLGTSRPTWKTLSEIGAALGLGYSHVKAQEVFLELAKDVPAFQGMTYADLEPHGAIWRHPRESGDQPGADSRLRGNDKV